MSGSSDWLDPAFEAIAIDDDGRACSDIPDSACADEAGNFFTHVSALSLSKSADALIDPKLVLSWLLPAVGAPAALVGFLVPIREAGALLPQLFTAEFLRRLPLRKWAWSAGAVVQGLAALAIAFSALSFTGITAGIAILVSLSVLATARSVCSVCYKDVLGKTVDKSRRGRTTGLASSLAATTAIIFALLLSWSDEIRFELVIAAIGLAGALWIVGGMLFLRLTEKEGATDGGASAFRAAMKNVNYLKSERQLRIFILTRSLLTATAFAAPFMVAMGSGSGSGLDSLGWLVFASALAGLTSSFFWGKLSDQSSKRVLFISALVGAAALAATFAAAAFGIVERQFVLPVLLFVLMIGYQGVRLGRSTHLVDMANTETRAAFTALSNTIVGIVLLIGGVFSLVASVAGLETVIAILAGMCCLAAITARQLEDVQSG